MSNDLSKYLIDNGVLIVDGIVFEPDKSKALELTKKWVEEQKKKEVKPCLFKKV